MVATNLNFDTLRERLRERVTEAAESDLDTLCDNCQATLTATDRRAGYCTQCNAEVDDVDEQYDEDLADDDYGDY